MLSADLDPHRVLLVRLSHLGDCARALPLFWGLARRWPDAELAWAIEPPFASLVERLPGLGRVVRFERRGGWRAWPALRRQLAGFAADLAIDVQGNSKSAAVTWASRAPRRIGQAPANRREPGLGRIVLNRTPAPTAARHASAQVEHLARALGCPVPGANEVAGLFTERLDAGRLALDALGSTFSEHPLLVQLGAPGDPRSLPLERIADHLHELLARGHAPIVLAGPGELESGRMLAAQFADQPRLAWLIGSMPLDELAGLFLVAAHRGGQLIGTDSGPAHLAAAVGLPCVTLHGPYDPQSTGLWPRPGGESNHRELLSPAPPACQPCAKRRCAHERGNVCLTTIAPAALADALESRSESTD